MKEKWKPISEEKIWQIINEESNVLMSEANNLWEIIKIIPEKWEEKTYGKIGKGFWVVAIYGNFVVWYNDIEDGFNISPWKKYGTINGYFCNQNTISQTMERILGIIKFGGIIQGQAGPPQSFH